LKVEMPPVDRNEPKRGRASDSRYSLMEFMCEYPDDAACLDMLWRERHKVSHKWLQGYLNEFCWRYNRRHSSDDVPPAGSTSRKPTA
jgi:hypothetical protein